MTADRHELLTILADLLLNAVASDCGNLSVNNACEFVDDDDARCFDQSSGDVNAELFAVAQNLKRSQPCRDRRESNAVERCGNVFNGNRFRKIVYDARL
jgi:hypothetical protein